MKNGFLFLIPLIFSGFVINPITQVQHIKVKTNDEVVTVATYLVLIIVAIPLLLSLRMFKLSIG